MYNLFGQFKDEGEKMLKIKKVDVKNCQLAKNLQAMIFPDEVSPLQIERGIKTNNPQNFIAFDGEGPVGIVGFYKSDDLQDHVLINWFGVLPQFRHNGYGTEILNWLIKKCKKREENYMTTYTEKGVNDSAIALYKKLGFAVKDYGCEEDIKHMKKLGISNNYVTCFLSLKGIKANFEFEKLNMHIAENMIEIEEIQKSVQL